MDLREIGCLLCLSVISYIITTEVIPVYKMPKIDPLVLVGAFCLGILLVAIDYKLKRCTC